MNQKQFAVLLLCGVLAMMITASVLAKKAEINLSWHVISGGGGLVQSGDRQLQHTIGQPISGSTRANKILMGSGFWSGVLREVPPPRGSTLFLPMVGSAEP